MAAVDGGAEETVLREAARTAVRVRQSHGNLQVRRSVPRSVEVSVSRCLGQSVGGVGKQGGPLLVNGEGWGNSFPLGVMPTDKQKKVHVGICNSR